MRRGLVAGTLEAVFATDLCGVGSLEADAGYNLLALRMGVWDAGIRSE